MIDIRTIHVVLFGLGSVGYRHARLLRALYPELKISAYRTHHTDEARHLGISICDTIPPTTHSQQMIAMLTNPTDMHIDTAISCAQKGMHLFIEKPVGHNDQTLDTLCDLVHTQHLTSYVAYCMRFHPVIQFLRKINASRQIKKASVTCESFYPHWRPGTDHLLSYSARADRGGGVLLDLSHELDYVEYLLGSIREIRGKTERRSDVTIDAEDYALLAVRSESCADIRIELNMASQRTTRTILLETETGTQIHADLCSGSITSSDNSIERHMKYTRDEMFSAQLVYFFNNLGRRDLMNNLLSATVLFRKILAFKESLS